MMWKWAREIISCSDLVKFISETQSKLSHWINIIRTSDVLPFWYLLWNFMETIRYPQLCTSRIRTPVVMQSGTSSHENRTSESVLVDFRGSKHIAGNFFNLEIEQKGGRIGFASTSKSFNPLSQSRKFFDYDVSILTYFWFFQNSKCLF